MEGNPLINYGLFYTHKQCTIDGRHTIDITDHSEVSSEHFGGAFCLNVVGINFRT